MSELLRSDNPELRDNIEVRRRAVVPMSEAALHLPIEVSGYTDFYSSKEHATNVGTMFRDPRNALLPNWLEHPVAYNGRASSVVVSGTPVRRPIGQTKGPDAARPSFGPTASSISSWKPRLSWSRKRTRRPDPSRRCRTAHLWPGADE